MRQRNPSHFGSYIHSLPMGKLFTARAFIGVIGGLRNLSIELLEVTTRNGIYFIFISCADLFSVTISRNTQFLIKSAALSSALRRACALDRSRPGGRKCRFVDSPSGSVA